MIQHSENIHMCTRYITHIIYKPGNPKTASTVFLVITVMHFVWAHAAFDVFNQYMIWVWILLNQMLRNCGFSMAMASGPRPYMAIYVPGSGSPPHPVVGNFWVYASRTLFSP